MKDVTYYEFIAVLNSVRVKVIVKEVAGREKHFWSVIPFWGIDKNTSRRVFYIVAIQSTSELKNAAERHSLVVPGYSLDSRDRAKALQAPQSV